MSQTQQTVLRVKVNNITGATEYQVLDLYSSIPIKITRSFADLTDISKKNSDTALNVILPGSKKNNAFFENFFDVDVQSFRFSAVKKALCQVLIDDESYFSGFLRLNKIKIQNDAVEYDCSLYSTVGNLYGDIGNNLLKDLNYADPEYNFNHTFNTSAVIRGWNFSNFGKDGEQPYPYIYPIVHNGYLYSGSTPNLSGGTVNSQTRLYTSSPILAGSYDDTAQALAAGVKPFRINTPNQGLINNQLKPALSVWNMMQLLFKEYGYKIKSDFMNTPWMKTLYMYGYFSSNLTKFSYRLDEILTLPLSQVNVSIYPATVGITQFDLIISQQGTGIPCYSDQEVIVRYLKRVNPITFVEEQVVIPPKTSGATVNLVGGTYSTITSTNVPVVPATSLRYFPVAINETVNIFPGDFVNFSLVIDPELKQIDFLSSIAKKFNLVLVPDPEVPNQIIIEPYTYFIGTGDIYDWSDKISFDTGLTVEPALNYVDSYLTFTDSEDGDYGNVQFKNRNTNRIYGQKYVPNNTDFRSTTGKTETTFSPEVFRQWDTADQLPNGGIDFPLGINYAGSTNTSTAANSAEVVNYIYNGVKTKPKLMWFLQGNNLLAEYSVTGKTYDFLKTGVTYQIFIGDATTATGNTTTYQRTVNCPIMSNVMPIGIKDEFKITNDSQSILFRGELSTDIGPDTFNSYTYNDAYNSFYLNRINNLYNPNTRYLKANFNISLADYKNLKPQDIIKVQNQYFTWNRISDYNLISQELTEVELVQTNLNPNVYPTRYFRYFYCDNPSVCYKLKTDFTNPIMRNTNFGWSVLYDHNCGIIYGANTRPSGFTSTMTYTVTGSTFYVPYTMVEISEDDYNSSGCEVYTCDSLMMYIYSIDGGAFGLFNMPTYYFNSGFTRTGLNLFRDCAAFSTIATREGVRLGSSTYFPEIDCIGSVIQTETPQDLNTENNLDITTETLI